ncbi:hypothetical protein [Shimazuella alba]|uniref:Uncharacterized protein n=1 Tax=Shimazuella alba TaxID=2690964 RepID=A0A6I4VUU4_9BACL|nr:hypothetical protein [Shimazuella alba]MXQ55347.1 hypothetical protein [Shimazuella alba]
MIEWWQFSEKGDTIQTKDGRRGVVFYVNRRIKYYQVICRDDNHELVPFEDVKVGGPATKFATGP